MFARYGDASRAHFHKGFFSETMPPFHDPVAAACVNVDLVANPRVTASTISTRCSRRGGHHHLAGCRTFPWIIELFNDNTFWEKEDRHKKKPGDAGTRHAEVSWTMRK